MTQHVTHFMTTQRRSMCHTGSHRAHPIADVNLGISDWAQVTCKRCLAARERNEKIRAKNAQPKVEQSEPTLEVTPLNPVKRDGMVEVKAFWGNKVRLFQDNTLIKEFPVTNNTVKNVIKFCNRHNYFPTNVKDGKIW